MSGESGSTYSVSLLPPSGPQISITQASSSVVPPPLIPPPLPVVSGAIQSLIPPPLPPVVSGALAIPAASSAVMPGLDALGSLGGIGADPAVWSPTRRVSGALIPPMDPSAANSSLQAAISMGVSGAADLPGPSGQLLGEQDPEEIIMSTYAAVQVLTAKINTIIQHNSVLATSLSRAIDGLNNINSKIQGSNSTLQVVQGQVDDIADTIDKIPNGIAEGNTGEEVAEENTGEEVAEENTGEEEVAEENTGEEEVAENMEGGGRNKKRRSHKKRQNHKRRSHKARK